MLVLTRRRNQSIKIGEDIEIIVVEIRGDQVRLGINAPRDLAVHREEVYRQIHPENGSQGYLRDKASLKPAILLE